MNVREILTRFGFHVEHDKLDGLEKKLEGIEKNTEKLQKRFEFLFELEFAKKIGEWISGFGEAAEATIIAADNAGVAAEQYQKLAISAQQSGVAQEQLSIGIRHLALSMQAAKSGNQEALATFAKIGVSPEQIGSWHNAQDALYALSTRMQGIKDPMERAALAQHIFGRSSGELNAWLAKGPEAMKELGDQAERMGAVLSRSKLEQLAESKNSLLVLFTVVKNLAATFLADLGPAIRFIVEKVEDFIAANHELLQQDFQKWAEAAAYALGWLSGFTIRTVEHLIEIWQKYDISQYLPTVAKIAGYIAAGWAIISITKKVAGVFEVLKDLIGLARFAPAAAMIAAIVVSMHDLYVILTTGSVKDTWINKAIERSETLKAAIQSAGESLLRLKQSLGLAGKSEGLMNLDTKQSILANYASAETREKIKNGMDVSQAIREQIRADRLNKGPDTHAPDLQLMQGDVPIVHGQAGGTINIDAPVTVNVPEGSNPQQTGEVVNTAVTAALNRKSREIERHFAPSRAY